MMEEVADPQGAATMEAGLSPLILDSIPHGVFTVDQRLELTSLNAEGERILGVQREAVLGRPCREVFHASLCASSCAMRETLADGRPRRDVRVDIRSAKGCVPLSVFTSLLRDRESRVIGGVVVMRDLSITQPTHWDGRGFGEMIGRSAAMRRIFALLPDIAASAAPVLIQGESGTGKELVARAIHQQSPRRDAPLVQVNCGALPDTLLESELFGNVRGAFTGARGSEGRFRAADGGSLLLDEVGETSPAFQVKLLRVLEDGAVTPLGSSRAARVDVRVIAATHRDLALLVAEGRFRDDLYYRLRVLPLTLPPLRERRDDVPLLIEHLLAGLRARTGKPIVDLAPEAHDALRAYDFPGNIRELANILERACALCHSDRIELDDLPPELRGASRLKPSERRIVGHGARRSPRQCSPQALRLVEALDANEWNRTRTAAALGIARNTLWRRMKEYGLL